MRKRPPGKVRSQKPKSGHSASWKIEDLRDPVRAPVIIFAEARRETEAQMRSHAKRGGVTDEELEAMHPHQIISEICRKYNVSVEIQEKIWANKVELAKFYQRFSKEIGRVRKR